MCLVLIYWFEVWCLQPTSHSMSNTTVHAHSLPRRNYIISIPSPPLLLSSSLCLSHAPSLASTHAHPHCTTSTCNLELHFPFLLPAISHPPSSLQLALLSVSHIHVPVPRRPDSHLKWACSSSPSSAPLSLSLSLFLLQFKLRTGFIVLTGKKPVQCISFVGWFYLYFWIKPMTPQPFN